MVDKKQDTKLFDGVVIFTKVIQHQTFSAAAEATGHSTSYISKEINKLEARLGVRLLNRTTRTLSLTPEGESYYNQCQQLVFDAAHAVSNLNLGRVEPKGLLKVSCPTSFGHSHLQPILSEYLRLYPEVSLELDFNDRKVDLIEEGYDLAIRAAMSLEDSSLICKKIRDYRGYTVASPQYLEYNGRPRTPYELIKHRCMGYSNHKQPNRWVFENQEDKKVEVDVPLSILCNSAEVSLAMVLDGHGICRLPEFYMEQQLANGEVEVLFEEYHAQVISVYALYPSRKHLSPKVKCFIELLLERLGQ
ncbi:LysR family transcriptional regulator [Psychrobium sp. 1_MG-2023]|uniref:LysR family transcriptional regulator n=1 Tax=Psychrobium sp. 1_MG-2023 TaxID=3062624 RepID=UPI000C3499A9|nr:LysR family transcriptional regulator [Psychrobium sp. 1_MG-2023]MDP2561172.1 LysR family transcriptional regulator [Psychrobium sp. 1_MG-2023]PKF55145.1 LysR family transcriptional regulator [Alteromonadales bacterium alter-6D02]